MTPLIPNDAPTAGLSDLAMVERHVREGVRHVRRQQEILDRLTQLGGDIAIATALLAEFEATLVQHRSHRDRLRAELRRPLG